MNPGRLQLCIVKTLFCPYYFIVELDYLLVPWRYFCVLLSGGIVVPRDLCSRVLDTSHSIAVMLPTRREAGVCSTALVDFLIGTHNEMVDSYHNINKETTRYVVFSVPQGTILDLLFAIYIEKQGCVLQHWWISL